jgi:hypothetical protein
MEREAVKTVKISKKSVLAICLTGLVFSGMAANLYMKTKSKYNNRISKLDRISKNFLNSNSVSKEDKERFEKILKENGVEIKSGYK